MQMGHKELRRRKRRKAAREREGQKREREQIENKWKEGRCMLQVTEK